MPRVKDCLFEKAKKRPNINATLNGEEMVMDDRAQEALEKLAKLPLEQSIVVCNFLKAAGMMDLFDIFVEQVVKVETVRQQQQNELLVKAVKLMSRKKE